MILELVCWRRSRGCPASYLLLMPAKVTRSSRTGSKHIHIEGEVSFPCGMLRAILFTQGIPNVCFLKDHVCRFIVSEFYSLGWHLVWACSLHNNMLESFTWRTRQREPSFILFWITKPSPITHQSIHLGTD